MTITLFALNLFVLKIFVIYYCDDALSVIWEIVQISIKMYSYILKTPMAKGESVPILRCHFHIHGKVLGP